MLNFCYWSSNFFSSKNTYNNISPFQKWYENHWFWSAKSNNAIFNSDVHNIMVVQISNNLDKDKTFQNNSKCMWSYWPLVTSLQISDTPPTWSKCQCVITTSCIDTLFSANTLLRLLMYSGLSGSPASTRIRLQNKNKLLTQKLSKIHCN